MSAWPLTGQAELSSVTSLLPGGPGDVCGDDVRDMPVQGGPVPGRISWWCAGRVGGGFLHVAERDPGVQCCCDECVSERMGSDGLGDSSVAGDPADDPPGAVPVQPPAICGMEDGSWAAKPAPVASAFGTHDAPSALLGVTVLGYSGQLVGIEAVALAGQQALAAHDQSITSMSS